MIEWERIAELQEDVGAESLAEVLDLFFEETEAVLDGLDQHLPPNRLKADLHFLKGSALNLGFSRVGAMCRAAEAENAGSRKLDTNALRQAYASSKESLLSGLNATRQVSI